MSVYHSYNTGLIALTINDGHSLAPRDKVKAASPLSETEAWKMALLFDRLKNSVVHYITAALTARVMSKSVPFSHSIINHMAPLRKRSV